MKVVAAYYRCSTEQQDLQRQIQKVHDYATANDYTIAQEFFDKESGTNPDREQFLALQEWVRHNPDSTIIAAELDRVSRGLEGYVALRSVCDTYQVTLRCLNVPQTGSADADEFIEGLLASFAKYERSLIVGRMFSGRISRLKSGIPLLGRASYGYRYIKIKDDNPPRIEIDKEEAAIVKEVFYLFTEQDQSLNKITDILTQRKVPTKYGKPFWSANSIKTMLKNETYIGMAYFNKHKFQRLYRGEHKYKKSIRPKSDWIPVPHPPIIDKETFAKAQALLDRPQYQVHNRKYDYLLTGIIWCGACFKRYNAYKAGNNIRFYRCSSRGRYGKTGQRIYCRNHTANADRLDPYIWKWVTAFYSDPNKIVDSYVQNKEKLATTAEYLEGQAKAINDKLNDLAAGDDRLLTAYTSGTITLNEMQSQKIKLTNERERLLVKLREYAKEVQKVREQTGLVDLYDYFRKEREVWESSSIPFEKQQELVKKVIKRVIVKAERGNYTLEFMIPSLGSQDVQVAKGANQVLSWSNLNRPYLLFAKDFTLPVKKYTRIHNPQFLYETLLVSKDVARCRGRQQLPSLEIGE